MRMQSFNALTILKSKTLIFLVLMDVRSLLHEKFVEKHVLLDSAMNEILPVPYGRTVSQKKEHAKNPH